MSAWRPNCNPPLGSPPWPTLSIWSSRVWCGGRPACLSTASSNRCASSRRQPVVLESFAQAQLGDLARRRVRNLIDEGHIVGQPPLGDTGLKVPEHILLRYVSAGLSHHHQ